MRALGVVWVDPEDFAETLAVLALGSPLLFVLALILGNSYDGPNPFLLRLSGTAAVAALVLWLTSL